MSVDSADFSALAELIKNEDTLDFGLQYNPLKDILLELANRVDIAIKQATKVKAIESGLPTEDMQQINKKFLDLNNKIEKNEKEYTEEIKELKSYFSYQLKDLQERHKKSVKNLMTTFSSEEFKKPKVQMIEEPQVLPVSNEFEDDFKTLQKRFDSFLTQYNQQYAALRQMIQFQEEASSQAITPIQASAADTPVGPMTPLESPHTERLPQIEVVDSLEMVTHEEEEDIQTHVEQTEEVNSKLMPSMLETMINDLTIQVQSIQDQRKASSEKIAKVIEKVNMVISESEKQRVDMIQIKSDVDGFTSEFDRLMDKMTVNAVEAEKSAKEITKRQYSIEKDILEAKQISQDALAKFNLQSPDNHDYGSDIKSVEEELNGYIKTVEESHAAHITHIETDVDKMNKLIDSLQTEVTNISNNMTSSRSRKSRDSGRERRNSVEHQNRPPSGHLSAREKHRDETEAVKAKEVTKIEDDPKKVEEKEIKQENDEIKKAVIPKPEKTPAIFSLKTPTLSKEVQTEPYEIPVDRYSIATPMNISRPDRIVIHEIVDTQPNGETSVVENAVEHKVIEIKPKEEQIEVQESPKEEVKEEEEEHKEIAKIEEKKVEMKLEKQFSFEKVAKREEIPEYRAPPITLSVNNDDKESIAKLQEALKALTERSDAEQYNILKNRIIQQQEEIDGLSKRIDGLSVPQQIIKEVRVETVVPEKRALSPKQIKEDIKQQQEPQKPEIKETISVQKESLNEKEEEEKKEVIHEEVKKEEEKIQKKVEEVKREEPEKQEKPNTLVHVIQAEIKEQHKEDNKGKVESSYINDIVQRIINAEYEISQNKETILKVVSHQKDIDKEINRLKEKKGSAVKSVTSTKPKTKTPEVQKEKLSGRKKNPKQSNSYKPKEVPLEKKKKSEPTTPPLSPLKKEEPLQQEEKVKEETVVVANVEKEEEQKMEEHIIEEEEKIEQSQSFEEQESEGLVHEEDNDEEESVPVKEKVETESITSTESHNLIPLITSTPITNSTLEMDSSEEFVPQIVTNQLKIFREAIVELRSKVQMLVLQKTDAVVIPDSTSNITQEMLVQKNQPEFDDAMRAMRKRFDGRVESLQTMIMEVRKELYTFIKAVQEHFEAESKGTENELPSVSVNDDSQKGITFVKPINLGNEEKEETMQISKYEEKKVSIKPIEKPKMLQIRQIETPPPTLSSGEMSPVIVDANENPQIPPFPSHRSVKSNKSDTIKKRPTLDQLLEVASTNEDGTYELPPEIIPNPTNPPAPSVQSENEVPFLGRNIPQPVKEVVVTNATPKQDILETVLPYLVDLRTDLQLKIDTAVERTRVAEESVQNKVDKDYVEKFFRNMRYQITEVVSKVETMQKQVPERVTKTELKDFADDLYRTLSKETSTPAGTVSYKCLFCGQTRNVVSGMITDPNVAETLGEPPQSKIGRSSIIYGPDKNAYKGKTKYGKPAVISSLDNKMLPPLRSPQES